MTRGGREGVGVEGERGRVRVREERQGRISKKRGERGGRVEVRRGVEKKETGVEDDEKREMDRIEIKNE